MARPDLSTPGGKSSYRAELRRVARGWRFLGLSMAAAALAGMIAVRMRDEAMLGTGLGRVSVAMMVLGWALLFFVIARRTRHHRRRMLG